MCCTMDIYVLHETLGFILISLGFYAISHKDDRHFTKMTTALALLWAINFLIIGAFTASAMAFLVVVRNLASLKRRGCLYTSAFFVVITVVVGFLTYSDIKDVFPILAAILGTVAYFHLSGIKMRMTFAGASSFWVIHNVIAGSISSTISESIGGCLHLITSYRLRSKKVVDK